MYFPRSHPPHPLPLSLPLAPASHSHSGTRALFSYPTIPPGAIKLHLNANPLIKALRSIQCSADGFCCSDAGTEPTVSSASRRFMRSCGWELSRAISHLWSNSASTKSRLSHVSEWWERAPVCFKCGAGTSRDFLIVFLGWRHHLMLDTRRFDRSCFWICFGKKANFPCSHGVCIRACTPVYLTGLCHGCTVPVHPWQRLTDDGPSCILSKIQSLSVSGHRSSLQINFVFPRTV